VQEVIIEYSSLAIVDQLTTLSNSFRSSNRMRVLYIRGGSGRTIGKKIETVVDAVQATRELRELSFSDVDVFYSNCDFVMPDTCTHIDSLTVDQSLELTDPERPDLADSMRENCNHCGHQLMAIDQICSALPVHVDSEQRLNSTRLIKPRGVHVHNSYFALERYDPLATGLSRVVGDSSASNADSSSAIECMVKMNYWRNYVVPGEPIFHSPSKEPYHKSKLDQMYAAKVGSMSTSSVQLLPPMEPTEASEVAD
jgi:hypothetical protein